MPRAARFICQACGSNTQQWAGRCETCNTWNSIIEEEESDKPRRILGGAKGRKVKLRQLNDPVETAYHLPCGISEFDRACGGGFVPGSALLIGGDPGIGKSTLLLQAVARISQQGNTCIYVSGEESVDQIRGRAKRLNISEAPVEVVAANSVDNIIRTLEGITPRVVVIDSIQTMFLDRLDSSPGTVSQVRACAQELIYFAKDREITVILVGHVTKEGQIAGPRVLEHMVDTVLYFQGDNSQQFRILRAIKNRFGATDEIGVFEMTGGGLQEVMNPSGHFIGEHSDAVTGTAVFAAIEGTRPILVEIQALVAPSALATPRRAVVGWDTSRLAQVMAVLDSRCGLGLANLDIYLNVAGGLRINEPAADLTVAAALVSSARDIPIPLGTVVFGEISLSGEVREVSQGEARLKEAAKLGFNQALAPLEASQLPLDVLPIRHLLTLVDLLIPESILMRNN